MKIAFVKDPHLMFGFNNNIRKTLSESWEKQIYRKLDFILETLIEQSCNTLILSGDVFDKSKSKDWSFGKFLKNKKALELFPNNDIFLYSVQGNHDMFNGNPKIENTIYGELVLEGIINHLPNNPLTFQTSSGLIKIFGTDYSFSKEEQEKKFKEINDTEEHCTIFQVSHTNISPNETQFTDFTYKELSEKYPNINVHLCGHYHLGYDPQIVNSVAFINPWNMTRVVRDYQVTLDKHKPQLVIMDLDNYSVDNLNWVNTIEIPHLSYNETFKEEVVSILKESKKFKFFESSELDGETTGIDLEKLLVDDMDNEQTISVIINKVLTDKTVKYKETLLQKAIEYLNE